MQLKPTYSTEENPQPENNEAVRFRYEFQRWLISAHDIDLKRYYAEFLTLQKGKLSEIGMGMIDFVCDVNKVHKFHVMSSCRKREYVQARFMIIALVYQFHHKTISLQDCGGIVGITHHTSAINALKKLSNWYQTEKKVKSDVDSIFKHYGIEFEIYIPHMK